MSINSFSLSTVYLSKIKEQKDKFCDSFYQLFIQIPHTFPPDNFVSEEIVIRIFY